MADENYTVTNKLRFSDAYFVVDPLANKYNDYLRGILKQKQRNNRVGYTGEVNYI